MAINIKEILHPSDSDSIKFEKVNYNFDQILANGGGPQGIQGARGEQGADGATGVKGQKGELGTTGVKGEPGTAITLWDSVAIGTLPNDSIIIKPKSASVTKSPTIWLGDSDFEEGVGPGKTNGEARLTLETGTAPDEVGHFLKYYKDSTHVLNVNNRYDGSTTWFSTKPDLGSSLNSLGIEFISDKFKVVADSEVDITTTSSNITFASGGNIEITGSTGFVNIARPVLVTGYLNVTGTSHIKIPAGTTADRPTGIQGMLRYNQTLTSFEGYDGTIWKGLGGLIDADQDTYIVAEQNTDEDILRFNVGDGGSPIAAKEVASMGETVSDGKTNSLQVIYLKSDQYNLGDIIVDNNKGLLTKANTATLGGDQAQPANQNSDKEFRRLDDYFYQESTALDSSPNSISQTPFKWGPALDGTSATVSTVAVKMTTKLIRLHKATNNSNQTISTARPVAIAYNNSTSKISYVKTGHMVQCWGQLDFYQASLDWNEIPSEASTDIITLNAENNQGNPVAFSVNPRVAVYFAELETFHYKNASDTWIFFPISMNMNAGTHLGTQPTSYPTHWGAIPPGANYFNILKVDGKGRSRFPADEYPESLETADIGRLQADFLNLEDIHDGQTVTQAIPTLPTSLSWSFSMPTDDKSYDVVSTIQSTYTETSFSASVAVGGGSGGVVSG